MTSGRNSRERVARNFIERYGPLRFRELLDLLANGTSGQTIADAFHVSRERVRQWKNTFGTVVTLYQIHPDVLAVVEGADRPSSMKGGAVQLPKSGLRVMIDED